MKTHFKFSEITLAIEHQQEPLAQQLLEELSPYEVPSDDRPHAQVLLHSVDQVPKMPEQAILIKSTAGVDREYRLGTQIYQTLPDALLHKDFDQLQLDIWFSQESKALCSFARSSVKWLIIKAAESMGYAFSHASGVFYKGHVVLFPAHFGRGKTSCLYRMLQLGADPICEDAALFNEDTVLSLCLKPTKKEGFDQRFAAEEIDQYGLAANAREQYQGKRILIFPEIWNAEHSEVQAMTEQEVLDQLCEIYALEAGWHAYTGDPQFVRQQQAQLLSGAICFKFFAGSHETEVRAALNAAIEAVLEPS